jgi:hypothetical protein
MMEIQEILTTILTQIGSRHRVLEKWNRNSLKTSEHQYSFCAHTAAQKVHAQMP